MKIILFIFLSIIFYSYSFSSWEEVSNNVLSGGNMVSSEDYTINSAIGQFSANNNINPQSLIVISGYLSQIHSDTLSPFVIEIISTGAIFTDNILWGVKENETAIINFSNDISTSISNSELQIIYVMDNLAQSVNLPYSFNIERGDHSLKITPTSNWPYGGTFAVYVSTKVKDINGLALAAPTTFYFSIIRNPDSEHISAPVYDPKNYITILPNSINEKFFVVASSIPDNNINIANEKLQSLPSAYAKPLKILKMETKDINGNKIQSNYDYEIYFSYDDTNNDGIIDNTNPPLKIKNLAIWKFDEDKKSWVKQWRANIDSINKTISLKTNGPTAYYSLVGSADTDVSLAHAYPVPFRPNAGNPSRYGTWSEGIKFTNLPSYGKIRIFTFTGELVREIDIKQPEEKWDIKNSGGEIVASGTYIWEITCEKSRKTGKLVVIK